MDGDQESDIYDESETTRRAEAALLRALSTPHKRQSEMKIGKRKRGAQQETASQEQSASAASHLADAQASQGVPM